MEIYHNLETQINQKRPNSEVIIGGDFNAKLEINHRTAGSQQQSRNGAIMKSLLANTELIPISIEANYGLWTRVNRNNPNEKSVIDYILTTMPISKHMSSIIIDEGQTLRIQGKKDSDHNTMVASIRINNQRKPRYIEKWNVNNDEGWKKFNNKIQEINTDAELSNKSYTEIENTITKTMEQTVGKKKIRIDKPPKHKSEEITEARKNRKECKTNFEEACKTHDGEEKERTKNEYVRSQANLRNRLEKYEIEMIEKRILELTAKAKIDPNTIWQARKKAKNDNELEYNTINEEGETITDPEKSKDHIANYFEDLYQARPGTPEYEEWTKHIKETVQKIRRTRRKNNEEQGHEMITPKEMDRAIKKLKRRKSIGPDKIPNEIFIESNNETRKIYLDILNNIHEKEDIPNSWLKGEIIRLYKGKGKKGKCSNERGITLASNVGKLYERIINDRIKKHIRLTEAQAGGIAGSATADHLISLKQTIKEIRIKGKTAYVVFLDVQKAYDKAWLDAILYTLNKNGIEGKNLEIIRKLNSNLSAKIRTRHGLTREIKIKDSIRQGGVLSVIVYATLIDEISKELKAKGLGIETEAGEILDSLLWMDDV